jgi:hypothetical protein
MRETSEIRYASLMILKGVTRTQGITEIQGTVVIRGITGDQEIGEILMAHIDQLPLREAEGMMIMHQEEDERRETSQMSSWRA